MICTFAWVLTEVALGQKKTLARRGDLFLHLKAWECVWGRPCKAGNWIKNAPWPETDNY
jgi:hypothetical protein